MAEEKEVKKPFELPSGLQDKVVHSMPHIQAFHYHGRKVVLSKQTNAQLLKLAQAKDCAVLKLKEGSVAKSAGSAPKAATKESESKDSKKPETSGKK
jgi:hypothetical protein